MPIAGRVFTITNLEAFVRSYLLRPDAPDPDTFQPMPGARVSARLTSLPFPIPGLVAPVLTADDGSFVLATPANAANLRVRLLVHQHLPVAANVFAPVFRSENVLLGQLNGQNLALYVDSIDTTVRIDQANLDDQLDDLKAQLGIAELTGVIQSGGIQLKAKEAGSRVEAFIKLAADLSADLDELVDATITNLDVRVAFPCNIFVNENAIKQQIRQGIRDAFEKVNEDIRDGFIAAVAEQQGLPADVVAGVVDRFVSITIRQLSFPQVGTGRAIEARPAIGVPRKLLTPTGILSSVSLAAIAGC